MIANEINIKEFRQVQKEKLYHFLFHQHLPVWKAVFALLYLSLRTYIPIYITRRNTHAHTYMCAPDCVYVYETVLKGSPFDQQNPSEIKSDILPFGQTRGSE